MAADQQQRRDLVPPEHALIFDEAQRAFDAAIVAEKHPGAPGRSFRARALHPVRGESARLVRGYWAARVYEYISAAGFRLLSETVTR
jgi:hypothetical protein